MKRWSALIATAALVTVPPSLFAQATLTGGRPLGTSGGRIGVLGPASSGLVGRLRGSARNAAPRSAAAPGQRNAQGRAGGNGGNGGNGNGGSCQIYGFLNGGLTGGGTLNSIGAFDVTGGQPPSFSAGTSAPSAFASGGLLTADAGAINPSGVVSAVPRNGGTLFQYATDPNCGTGTPFTTTLTSNPAGAGGAVVATASTLRMQATYTTQYVPDPVIYWCYYSNNPGNIFQCEVWSAQVTFNFLTSSFAAVGAASYSLRIVQATITSP